MNDYLVQVESNISGYCTRDFTIVSAPNEEYAERFGRLMLRFTYLERPHPCKKTKKDIKRFLAGQYDESLLIDGYWIHDYADVLKIDKATVEVLRGCGIFSYDLSEIFHVLKIKLP